MPMAAVAAAVVVVVSMHELTHGLFVDGESMSQLTSRALEKVVG